MKLVDIVSWSFFSSSSHYPLSLAQNHTSPPDLSLPLTSINTTSTNATLREVVCHVAYGTGLALSSCQNAWKRMPWGNDLYSYGRRADIAAGAHWDLGIPIRYLSDDGRCAIDITNRRDYDAALAGGDSATDFDVSEAAKTVLDRCVAARLRGGSIRGFSQRDQLLVTVTKYESRAVCEPTSEAIPFAPFCEEVLQKMQVRRRTDTFASSELRPKIPQCNILPRSFKYR